MPPGTHVLQVDQPDWVRWRSGAAPAFLLDIAAGILHDANAGGAHLWWGAARSRPLPLPLDRAMPALQALRERAMLRHAEGCLVLWTPRGALQCACAWHRLAGGPCLVALVVQEEIAIEERSRHRDATLAPALAAKLAHELRTPIGAVMAYAEVLAREHFGPMSNPRYRSYAQNILASATHALGVVDRMAAADAQSPDGGSRELRFCDLDPGPIVESCVTVMRPLALRAGVRLDVAFPARLPRIVADDVTVRQMLLNLLTNAVKFARPGDSVTLLVAHEEDGGLTFTVEDTGPGLEATAEPDAEAQGAKGLGLGLPLTRQLAEANGAAFAIRSAPGAGTRASISFGRGRVVPV